jgi:hypothetical protein
VAPRMPPCPYSRPLAPSLLARARLDLRPEIRLGTVRLIRSSDEAQHTAPGKEH